MSVRIIIGKNFGDEGKGLATDHFAALARSSGRSCLVIRHNGGGQAGHTVDLPDKRFIFHQLSSGSFRDADTYWSRSFLPDLYKLPEETADFLALQGKLPRIFGHPQCRCVYIDDVLINMALETARGSDRHGSCGMGINEAVERSADPDCCLRLGELAAMSPTAIYHTLAQLRRKYVPRRLAQLGLSPDAIGEYGQLLQDDNVLQNAAAQMYQALQLVTLREEDLVGSYEDVLFEGAQGLLLDENYLPYAPHLTSSNTGSDNPAVFLMQHMPAAVPEVVYVTRTYMTRHGAGPLPHEQAWDPTISVTDPTNLPNPWQGTLRLAPHGSAADFFGPMCRDLEAYCGVCTVSCMVTHTNETNGNICSTEGNIPIRQWFCSPETPDALQQLYLSATPYSQDISALTRNEKQWVL